MSSNRKLFKEAIKTFGASAQIDLVVEECAKLIFAIQKYKQSPHIKRLGTDVAEGIADVEIICAQMRVLFLGVPSAKTFKLEKLELLVKNKKDMWDKENGENTNV